MSASSTIGARQESSLATRRASRPTASLTPATQRVASLGTSCLAKGEAWFGARRWTAARLRLSETSSLTTSTSTGSVERAAHPHRARPPWHLAHHQLWQVLHHLHHQRVYHRLRPALPDRRRPTLLQRLLTLPHWHRHPHLRDWHWQLQSMTDSVQ
jgi:hypothetical protein